MLAIICILLILLVCALIALYIKQEDNDAQSRFIEHQSAEIDRLRKIRNYSDYISFFTDEE